MTDQEVIETLARRTGWVCKRGSNTGTYSRFSMVTSERVWRYCRFHPNMPPYLTSRDALAGMLAGLSDAEWTRVERVLFNAWEATERGDYAYYLLTLPPADLARAIAEVVRATS